MENLVSFLDDVSTIILIIAYIIQFQIYLSLYFLHIKISNWVYK